jgi:hypothetical protein
MSDTKQLVPDSNGKVSFIINTTNNTYIKLRGICDKKILKKIKAFCIYFGAFGKNDIVALDKINYKKFTPAGDGTKWNNISWIVNVYDWAIENEIKKKTEINRLTNELDRTSSEHNKITNNLTRASNEIIRLTDAFDDASKKLDKITSDFDDKSNKLVALTNKNAELQNIISTLTNKIEILTQESLNTYHNESTHNNSPLIDNIKSHIKSVMIKNGSKNPDKICDDYDKTISELKNYSGTKNAVLNKNSASTNTNTNDNTNVIDSDHNFKKQDEIVIASKKKIIKEISKDDINQLTNKLFNTNNAPSNAGHNFGKKKNLIKALGITKTIGTKSANNSSSDTDHCEVVLESDNNSSIENDHLSSLNVLKPVLPVEKFSQKSSSQSEDSITTTTTSDTASNKISIKNIKIYNSRSDSDFDSDSDSDSNVNSNANVNANANTNTNANATANSNNKSIQSVQSNDSDDSDTNDVRYDKFPQIPKKVVNTKSVGKTETKTKPNTKPKSKPKSKKTRKIYSTESDGSATSDLVQSLEKNNKMTDDSTSNDNLLLVADNNLLESDKETDAKQLATTKNKVTQSKLVSKKKLVPKPKVKPRTTIINNNAGLKKSKLKIKK